MELNINPREEFLMNLLKGINNLVVTTMCNINCCFCSRKFNPFETKLYHRDFNELVEEIKMFIPNNTKLVNCSISRMTDGEPFTHPRIWDILELIREKFPYRVYSNDIQITTNGTYLTEENLKKLEGLKGIFLVHSINSTNIEDWMKLSGSTRELAEVATNVPILIKKFNIEYVPSIVPMPNVVGWDGIKKTITDLDNNNVNLVRILLPTYTKYASKKNQEMLYCDENKFKNMINELKRDLKMQILLFPLHADNLTPRLYGAEHFGISPDDEIIFINNNKVFSQFHTTYNILLSINREDKKILVEMKSGEKREIDLNVLNKYFKHYLSHENIRLTPNIVEEKVKYYKKILVAHSKAGEEIIKKFFERAIEWSDKLKSKEFYFQTIYNDFYGGSVQCAGLLTCQDYKKYIQKFIDEKFKPDLILMSGKSFDTLGRDLLYESIHDVCNELEVKFEIL